MFRAALRVGDGFGFVSGLQAVTGSMILHGCVEEVSACYKPVIRSGVLPLWLPCAYNLNLGFHVHL